MPQIFFQSFFCSTFLAWNFTFFVASCYSQTERESYFIALGFNYPGGAKEFFRGNSHEDIRKLKFHSNPKISLYACWIDCCLNCKHSGANDGTESNAEKDRFVSFLSGRLNSQIPEWWRRQIVRPSSLQGSVKTEDKDFVVTNDVNHAIELKVTSLSDKLIEASCKGTNFSIEWDREDYWNHGYFGLKQGLRCIAISSIDEEKIIYAISDDFDVLLCCTTRSGKELWKKKTGPRQQSIANNLDATKNYIEIVVSEGKINMFSANLNGPFVGSYDVSTGETICEFTTAFYFDPEKTQSKKR